MKQSHKIWMKLGLLVGVIVLAIAFLLSPLRILKAGTKQIYVELDAVPAYEAVIVFGAGLKSNGFPSDALKDRLDTAADLYDSGRAGKILVSGDNRVEDYNEPDNMKAYLIDYRGLPESDVVPDYGGRRTYDTCARAHEVWGLEKALLISQGYHLSRAIYSCEALGIDVEGVSATRRDYVYASNYKFREILALYKAVLDVNVLKPSYIGGEPEDDFMTP